MRRKLAAKPGQIESSVDLPHQMIFGDRIAKMKLIKQLTLVTLQTAHHGSTPPRFASTQRNHRSRLASTDFCNKIDPLQTCQPRTGIPSCSPLIYVKVKQTLGPQATLSGTLSHVRKCDEEVHHASAKGSFDQVC